jgi:hypothetical protein
MRKLGRISKLVLVAFATVTTSNVAVAWSGPGDEDQWLRPSPAPCLQWLSLGTQNYTFGDSCIVMETLELSDVCGAGTYGRIYRQVGKC